VILLAAFAMHCVQAAPQVDDWPGSNAPATASLISSAKLSGLWATGTALGHVRVYDIRGSLIHEISAHDLNAVGLLSSSRLAGMCFTDSGRQLFMAFRGDTGDCIAAVNLNTKELRVFAKANWDGEADRVDMVHWRGQLYVATQKGLEIYEATRNVKYGEVKAEVPFAAPVKAIASDSVGRTLYAVTGSTLYGIDLTADKMVPQKISTGRDFRALAFARTYGGPDNGGLYALEGTNKIVFASAKTLRTSEPVEMKAYHEVESEVSDLAATACGRILLAGTPPKVLSDDSDTRLDFEAWLRDEFAQYVLMNRSVLWPDGEPEGWVKIGAATAGHERAEPVGSVAAAVTVYMLLVSDSVMGNPDAHAQVRSILKRYAGMHSDGIVPHRNIDGQYVDFCEPETGEGTWGPFANTQCYGIMFIMAAADRAREFYPDDAEIARAAALIILPVLRMGDYVEPTGAVYFWGDEYGPFPGAAYGPYNETVLFAHIAAAQDPLCTHIYANILHHREDVISADGKPIVDRSFLAEEPVLFQWLTVFAQQYGMTILENRRQEQGWRQEYANYYSHFCAWTDDNAPPYLTVFSAGEGLEGYSPDTLVKHPGSIIHFPSVLGFSMLGDTAPAVGAYLAYRDGRRIRMEGTSEFPGAEVLVRFSPEKPDWIPASHSQVDYHFGLMGLAELIKPGVVDEVCAGHFYRETLDVGSTADGRVRLAYSRLTPRRVLARNGAEDWVSLGFHESPFTLDQGVAYETYRVEDPEGDVVFLFDESSDSGFEKTVDVAADFPETIYVVRTNVKRVNDAPLAIPASIQVWWDDDTAAVENVNGTLDAGRSRIELTARVEKPSAASCMGIRVIAENGLVVDNVSVIRVGALMPLTNRDFDKGDLSDWSEDGDGTASVALVQDQPISGAGSLALSLAATKDAKTHRVTQGLDISTDPRGTRYIIRAKAKGETLTSAFGALVVRFQRDTSPEFDPKREYFSNKIRKAGLQDLIRTVRKREQDEVVLRVGAVIDRPAEPESPQVESVLFDDIQVHKILPQVWRP